MVMIFGKEWKLVPAVATEEMIDAACSSGRKTGRTIGEKLAGEWEAMHKAAPIPEMDEELVLKVAQILCSKQGFKWEDQFSIHSTNGDPEAHEAFKEDARICIRAIFGE